MEYKLTKDLSQKFQADLQNCEDEPIHKLGKIQNKGLLLGFSYNLDLLYFSANLEPILKPLLQESVKVCLVDLFSEPVKQGFFEFIEGRSLSQVYPKLIDWQGVAHKLRFCKSGVKQVIIELEVFVENDEKGIQDDLSALDNFLKLLSDFKNEQDMASNAVSLFKRLTGFDRVMYYRFDEKGDGEVLAEEKSFGLESFLGLRYPASDIPRQARELYLKNTIRSIPDVYDEGMAILGINHTEPVDLSYAVFRTTSPIHNQYLKNMGVMASFGTSIVNKGKLWGMIICHSYQGTKKLSFNKRLLSLFFTNGISLWLQTHFVKEQDRLWQFKKDLFYNVRVNLKADSLFDLLLSNWEVLSKELKVQGFCVYDKNGLRNHGRELEKADCLKIVLQLVKASKEVGEITSVFYNRKEEITNELNVQVAGLAGIWLEDPFDSTVIFFRDEKVQIYNWAGKPESTQNAEGLKGISPRKSFQSWQESVENEALPWLEGDKDMITELGTALQSNALNRMRQLANGNQMELMLEKKVNELNYSIFLLQGEKKQLKRKMEVMVKTVKEADRFNSLKSVIMSNMSHEMRTPLNGIMGLATLINESEAVDSDTRHFGELIYESGERMLHTFNRLMELDLNDEKGNKAVSKLISLEEFFKSNLETRSAIASEKGQILRWHIHNQQESIVSNDLVLSQIVMNLVNNALKYSGSKAVVDVHVKILTTDDSKNLRISVEDNGPGIAPAEKKKIFEPFYMSSKVTGNADNSSGLGLYIVKTYVEYLGGVIDVTSILGSGSNFTVNIPVT